MKASTGEVVRQSSISGGLFLSSAMTISQYKGNGIYTVTEQVKNST